MVIPTHSRTKRPPMSAPLDAAVEALLPRDRPTSASR